jgi:Fe-S cluster assembly protein SufD
MSNITARSDEALGGPEWLVKRRNDAAIKLASLSLPTEQEENWRYGAVDELDLERYAMSAPAGSPSVVAGALTHALLEAIGPCAGVVVVRDGVVVSLEMDATAEQSGVRVARLTDQVAPPVADGEPSGTGELFAALGERYVTDGVVIEADADAQLELPIVIVHEVGASDVVRATFPRTVIKLGDRAEINVVEAQVSGDEDCLVVPITELYVGEEADLAYNVVQQLGRASWQFGYLLSEVRRAGIVRCFAAGLGGRNARLFTRARLLEEDAECDLSAVYLATGAQVQDFRTFVEHEAPRSKSNLVFKGAVDDDARSIYTGLVHMHKGARRADSAQTNRNLVLSEGAHADSVPNLDIEENDVKCSHASAVGPVDADQRFYLESRGVPPEIAERLILLGFFEDLLEKVSNIEVARYVSEVITSRLAGSGA